jgi:hypothetical protein
LNSDLENGHHPKKPHPIFILDVLTDTSFTPDILRKAASGTPDVTPCPIGDAKLELLNNDELVKRPYCSLNDHFGAFR